MKAKKALHTSIDWQTSRPAIDAVLSFATMKIEGAEQIDRALSHAAWLLGFGADRSIRFTLDDGVLLPFAKPASTSDQAVRRYQSDQKTLQRWLKKIANWENLRSKEKSVILDEIKPWTERNDARLRSNVVEGKLVRSISYDASSVQHVIGEVMYLIFHHGIAESGGIASCPECQEYFVKDRTDQKVCSNRCRQRQYRRLNEVST